MTLAVGVHCQDGFFLCSEGFSLVTEKGLQYRRKFARKINRLGGSKIALAHSGIRSVAEKARELIEKEWNLEGSVEDLLSIASNIFADINEYAQYKYHKEKKALRDGVWRLLQDEKQSGGRTEILVKIRDHFADEIIPNLETGAFLAGYHKGEEILTLITPEGNIIEPRQTVAIGAGSKIIQKHLRQSIKKKMFIKDTVPLIFYAMEQATKSIYSNDVLFPAIITEKNGYQDFFDESQTQYIRMFKSYSSYLQDRINQNSDNHDHHIL